MNLQTYIMFLILKEIPNREGIFVKAVVFLFEAGFSNHKIELSFIGDTQYTILTIHTIPQRLFSTIYKGNFYFYFYFYFYTSISNISIQQQETKISLWEIYFRAPCSLELHWNDGPEKLKQNASKAS